MTFPSVRISESTLIDLVSDGAEQGDSRKNLNHFCLTAESVDLGALADELESKGVTIEWLSVLDPLRDCITCLCAQGGLAGHPQVSLPGSTVDGLPVGLSIIGPRGSDASLVAVARALEAAQ